MFARKGDKDMPLLYGAKELRSISDWQSIIPPKHWVPTRSAYELAEHWHGCKGFPSSVSKVLARAFPNLTCNYGMVELPVFLDNFKAPSRTDIMLYCSTPAGDSVVVGVEGKTTEPFDAPVAVWVRDGHSMPTPSRSKRLLFLSELLGVTVSPDARFGYQLVHRTASVISECLLRGASSGVLLIHSFSDAAPTNWSDFHAFTSTLGIQEVQQSSLAGPVEIGPKHDVKIYFAWVSDKAIGTVKGEPVA